MGRNKNRNKKKSEEIANAFGSVGLGAEDQGPDLSEDDESNEHDSEDNEETPSEPQGVSSTEDVKPEGQTSDLIKKAKPGTLKNVPGKYRKFL